MNEPISTAFLAKVLGALGGSLISLAVLIPKGKREAFLRLCVSFISGLIFGAPLQNILGWEGLGTEFVLSASTLAAFAGWFIFGVLARSASKWRTLKDMHDDIKGSKK